MRQRFYKIIVVLIFTAFQEQAQGQNLFKDSLSQYVEGPGPRFLGKSSLPATALVSFAPVPPVELQSKASSTQFLANDYYTRNFGFFCRKELQVEKRTRLHLRVRLGSLEYCDYLEAK